MSQRWVGRVPLLSESQVAELRAVAAARAALPSTRQLAERLGVSRATVHAYLRDLPKRYRHEPS
jgi:DNA-binding transcriptional MocR family regulator